MTLTAPFWPRAAPGGVDVDFGVEAQRLDVAHAVLADLGDAQQVRAAIDGKCHDIAGLQRQAARRQGELRPLAGGPGLEQPHLGDPGRLFGIEHQRQVCEGDAAAAAGEAARLLHRGRIVAAGGDEGDLCGGGQIRLLRPCEGGQRDLGAGLHEVVGRELRGRLGRAAVGEDDPCAALAGVEEEGEFQRLQRVARRHHAIDDEAPEETVEGAGVVGRETVVGEDRPYRRGERRAGDAAGEPVAETPVGAVAPGFGVGGEGGPGARVPGVDVQAVEVDHAAAVDGGERVDAGDIVRVRRVEAFVEGLQVAALHEVVALAVREVGQLGLRALGVDEDVGLVGAAVDGGAAELHEPERLGLRHPGGGRRGLRRRRGG